MYLLGYLWFKQLINERINLFSTIFIHEIFIMLKVRKRLKHVVSAISGFNLFSCFVGYALYLGFVNG